MNKIIFVLVVIVWAFVLIDIQKRVSGIENFIMEERRQSIDFKMFAE